MKKIKLLLKSNAGFTNTIEMLGVAIIVSIMTIVSIVMAGYIHNLTVLDRFADEMVAKAALEGKCAGAELDERYESSLRVLACAQQSHLKRNTTARLAKQCNMAMPSR